MTIKNILKGTATLLNERQVLEYIADNADLVEEDSDGYRITSTLLNLLNFVTKEIFTKYRRITTKEQLTTTTRRIYFNSLKKTPIEIKNVYNSSWQVIEYNLFASYLETTQDAFGIEYVYVPKDYRYTADFEVEEMFMPVSALMYCVAREYCLTLNRFEESVFWHQKFIDVISEEEEEQEENTNDDTNDGEQDEGEEDNQESERQVKNYVIKERSWL